MMNMSVTILHQNSVKLKITVNLTYSFRTTKSLPPPSTKQSKIRFAKEEKLSTMTFYKNDDYANLRRKINLSITKTPSLAVSRQ